MPVLTPSAANDLTTTLATASNFDEDEPTNGNNTVEDVEGGWERCAAVEFGDDLTAVPGLVLACLIMHFVEGDPDETKSYR